MNDHITRNAVVRWIDKPSAWKWIMRTIIALVFAAVAFTLHVIMGLYFRVVLEATTPVLIMAELFCAVAYLLAWVLRGAWKSNRDTAIQEMGELELSTYIAHCRQEYEDRYGKDDAAVRVSS